jgi:site-specific DNA-cytosine methylase
MKRIGNVLSLFDGMSCGQIALNRLGIEYETYFSSEINLDAMSVTRDNYPRTEFLGDVWGVNGLELPIIDLLMGGSPCQGFSRAGKKLNFDDPRSRLFFEFVRLKDECKPKYFLLENVLMGREEQEIITEYLDVEPIKINSSLLSAQNRVRMYWTNIPNVRQPEDKGIILSDIIDSNTELYQYKDSSNTVNRVYKKNYMQYDPNNAGHAGQSHRAFYLYGKHGCLDTYPNAHAKILEDDGRVRKITRNEAERLQTIPDNYTSSVSTNKAWQMIGNGWTVDVIAHILGNMFTIEGELSEPLKGRGMVNFQQKLF